MEQQLLDFSRPKFHGITFEEIDRPRLTAQLGRVSNAMSDGSWRTLREISDITLDGEASISARLRQLRSFGYTVDRRRRGEAARGIFEYRVTEGE